MNGEKQTICVVDDEPSVIAGLEALLHATGYEVLAFRSADRFLESVDTIPEGSVILADVYMRGLDGIRLTERLGGGESPFPVVIMTGHASVGMAVAALRAGASDFVEKPFTRVELLEALERARTRRSKPGAAAPHVSADLAARRESLSPREQQVLKLMIAGESSKAIGRRLGISPRTVEVHRSHVLHKMDSRNLAELIHKAARLGIDPAS